MTGHELLSRPVSTHVRIVRYLAGRKVEYEVHLRRYPERIDLVQWINRQALLG